MNVNELGALIDTAQPGLDGLSTKQTVQIRLSKKGNPCARRKADSVDSSTSVSRQRRRGTGGDRGPQRARTGAGAP